MIVYGYNIICFGKRIARRRRRFTRGSPRITRFTVCRGFGRPSGGCIPTVSHGTGCKQVQIKKLITMNTCSNVISHGITRNHKESHGITRYHTTSNRASGAFGRTQTRGNTWNHATPTTNKPRDEHRYPWPA